MKNLHSQIDIFYNTKNWKNYWTQGLSNFIRGDILDVGSGTGSNIPFYSKVSKHLKSHVLSLIKNYSTIWKKNTKIKKKL